MNVLDSEERRLVVNLVSETAGASAGHGVHTAFLQTKDALERRGVDVRVNATTACDIAHVETMGLRSVRVLLRAGERAVVTAHIVPQSLVGSFMLARLWLPIATIYMRFVYALADELLAVSPIVVDGLAEMGLTAPVRLVPNAIDIAHFEPHQGWREDVRSRLGIPDDAFVAICAGQVQPRKGVKAFIATAHEMPDATFVWVGGMPFKRLTAHYREMRRLVASAPSNCIFTGEIPYDEMPRYLASADCLLFTSLQETFGFSIIEAAAAGLPLVLRNLPTYDPLFGGAYLTADDTTFATRVAELRDDTALREEFAARARRLAKRYDLESHVELLMAAYGEVIGRAENERPRGARRMRPALQWLLGMRAQTR